MMELQAVLTHYICTFKTLSVQDFIKVRTLE